MVPLATVAPRSPWDDLAHLGKMIGNATIVALGEGIHCGAEPLEFRNRVLQYLVREKGFTAIAIESGIVESRAVHDYVRGGSGDLSTVLSQGIGWTFDRLPQNRDLVRWLREHNAGAGPARKVNFYGFDVPGSAGNSKATRGVDTALAEALRYVASVDETSARAFHVRLDALMANLRFDPQRLAEAPGYDRLSQANRDALTAAIAELVILLERREAQYTAASTTTDYEWGYRAAIGARQVDNWLRQIPIHWRPSTAPLRLPSERARFLLVAEEMRERAQADNLDWILKREGTSGKILVFAHRYHLSTTPVIRSFENGAEESKHEVAGTYLRRRFGERLLTIGNLIGQGEVGCGEYRQLLERAPAESIDGLAAQVGEPLFLLDLRTAPASVANWLNQERSREHSQVAPRQAFKLAVGRAFDVLFYLDTVTPACSRAESS